MPCANRGCSNPPTSSVGQNGSFSICSWGAFGVGVGESLPSPCCGCPRGIPGNGGIATPGHLGTPVLLILAAPRYVGVAVLCVPIAPQMRRRTGSAFCEPCQLSLRGGEWRFSLAIVQLRKRQSGGLASGETSLLTSTGSWLGFRFLVLVGLRNGSKGRSLPSRAMPTPGTSVGLLRPWQRAELQKDLKPQRSLSIYHSHAPRMRSAFHSCPASWQRSEPQLCSADLWPELLVGTPLHACRCSSALHGSCYLHSWLASCPSAALTDVVLAAAGGRGVSYKTGSQERGKCTQPRHGGDGGKGLRGGGVLLRCVTRSAPCRKHQQK